MSTSAGYNKTLTDIGAASSFDPSKLSSATVESMVSHVNLLKRNKVPINKQALTADPVRLLDSLVTTKGKKLTPLYKLQIAATLRRMYPNDISIDLRKYNRARESKVSRVSSQPFMQAMRRIIDAASAVLKQAYVEEDISDLAKYDTALVVLLSSCTSMRVSELYQLKTTDIDTIRRNEPVVVRSKGSRGGGKRRVISPNDLLLTVLNTIQEQREKAVRAATDTLVNNRSPQYKAQRIAADYILLTSISHMRRKLKEIAASFGVRIKDVDGSADKNDPDGHTMGFNAFRKYITTVLVEGGGHTVAQAINNHTSLNTTLSNYHIQGAETTESTFDRIDTLMAELGPRTPPLTDGNNEEPVTFDDDDDEELFIDDARQEAGGSSGNDDETTVPEYVFPPTPMTPGYRKKF